MAGSLTHDAPPLVALRPQFCWDTAATGAPAPSVERAAEPVCLDEAVLAHAPGSPPTHAQMAVLCSGHGPHGQAAAVLSAKLLAEKLLGVLVTDGPASDIQMDALDIERAFESCQRELCAAANLDTSCSGASALTLMVLAGTRDSDGYIVAASAGMCRAVLARAHDQHKAPSSPSSTTPSLPPVVESIQLTVDATLDAPLERSRVEADGARVVALPSQHASSTASGSCSHALAPWEGGSASEAPASRVLGCTAAQAGGVTALPVVLRWRRCSLLDKFLIVGSEGLWRAFSKEEAVEFVQRYCEAAAAAGAAAAGAKGYSLCVADALTLEAQERLKLRQGAGIIPDVTAIVLPLAPEYCSRSATDAASSQHTTELTADEELAQSGVANGAAAVQADMLPTATRSNAEAALLARSWASGPQRCPASTAAAAPFPALLPLLRSHPWPLMPASPITVRPPRRVAPPRRSSLGIGFALTQRQSSELELSRDTWSSESNVSSLTDDQFVVVHKVRLNGHYGPPEMESMLYASATSGRPDTTVARHLGPPSPMPRANSINVATLSLASSRRANSSSGTLASPTAGAQEHTTQFDGSYSQGYGRDSRVALGGAASAPPHAINPLRKARSYQALAALAASSAQQVHGHSSSSLSTPSSTPHSLAAAGNSSFGTAAARAWGVSQPSGGPVASPLAFPAYRSAFAIAGPQAHAAGEAGASSLASSTTGTAASSSSTNIVSGGVAKFGSSTAGTSSCTEPFPGLREADAAASGGGANMEHPNNKSTYARMAASMRQLLSAPGASAPGSPFSSGSADKSTSYHAADASHSVRQGTQQSHQGLQGLKLLLPQSAADVAWASNNVQHTGEGSIAGSEEQISSPMGSISSAGGSDRMQALAGDLARMDSKKAWKDRPEPCVHNGMRKGYLPRHLSMPSLTSHFHTTSELPPVTVATFNRHSTDSSHQAAPAMASAPAEASGKAWVRPPPLLVMTQHVPNAPGSPMSFGALSAPHPMERTQSARARRSLTHGISSASLSDSFSQGGLESPVGRPAKSELSFGHGLPQELVGQQQQQLAAAGVFAQHGSSSSLEVGSPAEEGKVHGGLPRGVASSPGNNQQSLFARRPPSRAHSFPQPGSMPAPTSRAFPVRRATVAALTAPAGLHLGMQSSNSIEHLSTRQGSITKVHLQQRPSAARSLSTPTDFGALADAAAAAVAAGVARRPPAGGSSLSSYRSVSSAAALNATFLTTAGGAAAELALPRDLSSGSTGGSFGSSNYRPVERSVVPPQWCALHPDMQVASAFASSGSSGNVAATPAADTDAAHAAPVALPGVRSHPIAAPLAVPSSSSGFALPPHGRTVASPPASVSMQKHSHIMQLPVLQESDSEIGDASGCDDSSDDSNSSNDNGAMDSLLSHLTSLEPQDAAPGSLQQTPLSHLPAHLLPGTQRHRSISSTTSAESCGEATFDCNISITHTQHADSASLADDTDDVAPEGAAPIQRPATAAATAADAAVSLVGRGHSFEFSRHHVLDQFSSSSNSSSRHLSQPSRLFGKPRAGFSASAPAAPTSAEVLLAAAATAASDMAECGAAPALQLSSAFGTGDAQAIGSDVPDLGPLSARSFRSAFGNGRDGKGARDVGGMGPAGLLWGADAEGRVHRGSSSLSLLLQQGLQAMSELDVLGECGEGGRAAAAAAAASMAPATAY